MPDNEFDRIFSEKLGGVKPAYDAQDWAAMQQMLNNKPAGRPLMFWWAAAALLISALSAGAWYYSYQSSLSDSQMAGNAIEQSEQSPVNGSDNIGTSGVTETEGNTNSSNNSLRNNENTPKEGSDAEGEKKETAVSGNNKNNSVESQKPTHITRHKKQQKGNDVAGIGNGQSTVTTKKDKDFKKSTHAQKNTAHTTVVSTPVNGNYSEIPPVEEMANLYLQQINLSSVNAAEEKMQLAELAEQDEPIKPKKGKVKFNIAAYSGLAYTRTDPSTWAKPGFNAGIATEMMIKRRVGISIGVGYTVMKYGSKDVQANYEGYQAPESYTSEIKAVEIPLDIRVNMLNKGRWSLFAGAGINNIIKLSESYDYVLAPVDTLVPEPPRTPPGTTNLGGNAVGENAEFDTANGVSGGGLESSNAFYARRYLPVGRVTVGVEYAISKVFSLQAAPIFSLSLPYVGIQDKRVYSLGFDARVNCYF
jgi:hypothetical protein